MCSSFELPISTDTSAHAEAMCTIDYFPVVADPCLNEQKKIEATHRPPSAYVLGAFFFVHLRRRQIRVATCKGSEFCSIQRGCIIEVQRSIEVAIPK
jgi:hypothetical protein